MRRTVAARAGILVATTAAVVAIFAAPAAAHVTITPTSATQGESAQVTFNVPNEEDKATTVKLEVQLPADKPIAEVSIKPVPGWTAVATSTKLATPITTDDGDQVTEAVTLVTWTAQAGAGIKPGEFQEFTISAGPLPESDSIVFKAVQTYSNGDVVHWIDPTTPGGKEPDHPAPVLTLTKADAGSGSDPAANPPVAAASTTNGNGNGGGALLGLLGLLAGIAGLVVAIIALRRTSARPTA